MLGSARWSRSSVNFISQLLHGKILQTCFKAIGPHLQQQMLWIIIHTMLETSYKKLNGSGQMDLLGIIKTGIHTDYPTWIKKYSVSHIYSIYFVSVGRSIIWICTILLLSIVCLVNVYIHTNIVDGLGGWWVNCRENAIYGYSCLKLTSFVGQGWAPGRHSADTGVT